MPTLDLFIARPRCVALVAAMAWGLSSHAQGNQAESADLSDYTGGGGMPLSVNTSTGQLSGSIPLITIPGLDGEGYQMSLNYAPPTPGSEASWVGYGWSLSPGAIQRNQNGIADDFKGTIINISKKPDYTRMTGRFVTGAEALSAVNGNIGTGAVWDSDRGVSPSVSLSLSGFGAGIRYLHEGGEGIFSASVNPVQMALAVSNKVRGSGDGFSVDQSAAAADAGNRRAPAASDVTSGLRASVMDKLQSLHSTFVNSGIAAFNLRTKGMLSMRAYENPISGTTGAFVGTIQGSLAADIGGEVGFDTHWTSLSYEPVDADKEVTGYLRGGERAAGMDFTMERADVVDEYDKFVAAPVAMPDRFSVSAQGLAGSFRGHFRRPGTFHDDPVDYDVEQGVNLGLEFAAGVGNVTAGATVTDDLVNTMEQEDWGFSSSPGFGDEGQSVFFAFDDEPGLNRAYGAADEVPHATGAAGLQAMLAGDADLVLQGSVEADEPIERQMMSKWIRWNTVLESNDHHTHAMKTVYPMRFCNQSLTGDVAAFRTVMDGDHIGEFEVVNESGVTYTFGIPVLERDRVELSFTVPGGVDPLTLGPLDYKAVATGAPPVGDFLSGTRTIESVIRDSDSQVITGRIIRQPVATSYLLTSITSADYVDLTLDGPSEDDLGTWVLFHYEKDFGAGVGSAEGEWFQFRNPYWANHFKEGNTADGRDDVASFTAGEKEVFRLSKVETRTHFAEFHASIRSFDGADVKLLDLASQGVERGSVSTRKLDSISLYAKGSAGDDLLRVVRLEYAPPAQSLMPGVQGPGTAALTLSGVTIQSTDVREEENMAHYGFGYQYPSAESVLPDGLVSRYGHLFGEHAGFSPVAQNPSFSFNASDAWGNPKLTAPSLFDVDHPWLDMRVWTPESTDRDPAAHCLKEVTTPGGLSIYPQYEVGDYRYVQDDPACIMVPLKSTSTSEAYVLDLDAVDAVGMDAADVADYLDEYFDGRMAYFKARYSLGKTDISKHFTGFTKVTGATVNGAGDVQLNLISGRKYTTPHDACLDYCKKFTNVSYGLVQDAPSLDEAGVQDFFSRVSEVESLFDLVPCAQFDHSDSYVRVPLLPGMEKHGGPLRVKRVLMLDEGVGTEGALLTGTVYDYTELSDGLRLSSGVAAHEPQALYDEFGRFLPLAKRRQTHYDKITQGRDAESQSGPVGDAFLPGPVVLYGEVATRQIHEGESTLGHTIQRYFTHKDHPTRVTWSDENETRLKRIDDESGFGPVSSSDQQLWFAQGVQVEHSPLPGRPRSVQSFGGRYDDSSTWYEVSSTEFDYFTPHEPLPFLRDWTASSSDQPRFDELYFRGRKIRTEQVRGSTELDLTYQFPFVLIPSGWHTSSSIRQVQATHGTTRTITRPLFTKSITTRETGKVTTVEHLAFDPITFQPVALATSDGYTGLSFEHDGDPGSVDTTWTSRRIAYSFPAHEQYPELGGMCLNDRKRLVSGEGEFEGMSIKKMKHSFLGHSLLICAEGQSCSPGLEGLCAPKDIMGFFSPGDLLRVSRKFEGTPATDDNYYHVDRVSGNRVFLHPSGQLGHKTWRSALDGDEFDANVEIVHSGRKNQLTLTSGSVEVYSEALDMNVSQRLDGELEGFIQSMNAARPAIPAMAKTQGEANLLGVSDFSDAMQLQEGGCKKVEEQCVLESFRVDFHPQCGVGYVMYPSGNTGLWSLETTEYQNPDGPINEFIEWDSDTCSSDKRLIPIRYNAFEEGGGRFEFDHDLGAIVWRTCDNPCNPVVIFTPCRDWSRKIEVDDVIASSETVFRDDLEYEFLPTGGDPYETGARGRWVQHSSWVAQSEASSLDAPDVHHSRQSGILDRYEALNEDFADFMVSPFVDADLHPWIRTSRATLFDRRGHTLETLDALGHYTSMEMGAQEKLVTWTAQGARNGACLFESFERREGGLIGTLSDSRLQVPAPMWSDERGHTGRRSLKLNVVNGASGQTRLGQVALDERSLESDGGVEVRFWVHNPKDASTGLRKFHLDSLFTVHLQEVTHSPEDGTTPISGGLTLTGTVFEAAVDSLVQTGAWTMMEARLPGSQLAGIPLDTRMLVSLHWEGAGAGNVYLDDLRVRPFNTSMACTVHDGDDFKVLAELDDDHFARKYQYNRLNQQVRTQVETAGGWKTVSESVQHTKPEGP